MRSKGQAVFDETLLPEGEGRWGSFSASLVLELLALAVVVTIPMLLPQKLTLVQHYWVMPLDAPHIEPYRPQPVKLVAIKKPVIKLDPKPKMVAEESLKPKLYAPVIAAPVTKIVRSKVQTPDMTQVAKAFPSANPQLSIGSSAIPTLRKPREAVQTGGFGDPNSVADNGKTNRNPNMAQLGSYDLPQGAGNGNGTGGAKGDRGVVASTGFGNEVAVGSADANRGRIQQGVFADEHTVTAGPRIRQTAEVSDTTPIEILFKPKPAYTDEARAKKIEGDVLLQVIFTAAGEVRVQRVVQGLGYGLDASAEQAARQIRFRPAQQEGQPVDSAAVVHITFELAY